MVKDLKNKSKRVIDEDGVSIQISGATKTLVANLKGKSKSSPTEHVMNASACEALNAMPGCHAHKVIGTVYSKTGQPDIIACYLGQMYCFEGKVRQGHKTPISDVKPHQRVALKRWCASGARVGIYTSADEIVKMLVAWNQVGQQNDFWLWYGAKGDEIWTHVDSIPIRD